MTEDSRLAESTADDPIPFSVALAQTEDRRRHLLIGNGFSIGADGAFRYDCLVEAAERIDPGVAELFHKLGALDFEDALNRSTSEARQRIRQAFVEVIAHIHPRRGQLPGWKRSVCADFLANFLRDPDSLLRGDIFTTNYDAVLSWIVMEHKAQLEAWDGFDSAHRWNEARAAGRIAVRYLHGAMHIYEKQGPGGARVLRLTGGGKNGPSLPEVVRGSVQRGMTPLVVSEGTAAEKAERMRSNVYLRAVARHFADVCDREDDVLFTYGHRLEEVDRHLTGLIGRGSIREVFIGVFSDDDVARARILGDRWQRARSAGRRPDIKVRLFDSRQTPVWEIKIPNV